MSKIVIELKLMFESNEYKNNLLINKKLFQLTDR